MPPARRNPLMSAWLSLANRAANTGRDDASLAARPTLTVPARIFKGLGRAASRMMSVALPLSDPADGRGGTAGRVTEIADFGSNPGGLRMLVYAPPRTPRAGAPLIVVLHGCRQGAESFAASAGWIDVARTLGVPLVLPEQLSANNRNRCFNWYRPGDVRRGRGEAMSIRQMVRTATTRFGSNRRRVYIVGLSAGGAMAAAMLASYPAVFAAGAVVAGMPVGSANTSAMALLRMHRGEPLQTRIGLVAALRASTPTRGTRPWPRLSIWQGERDRTVNPANAELLAAQWSGVHGFEAEPTTDAVAAPGLRHRSWVKGGVAAVELWTIADMAHGFPIDAREPGGGRPGPWVVDAKIAGARRIAAFWGLEPRRS